MLNEPKHNIKGGEITVQAAAPKNDRFAGGPGGYGGGGFGGGFDRGRGGYGGLSRFLLLSLTLSPSRVRSLPVFVCLFVFVCFFQCTYFCEEAPLSSPPSLPLFHQPPARNPPHTTLSHFSPHQTQR